MAKRTTELTQSRKLAKAAAQLAEDRHCRDIVVLEVADLSPVARHFVIATGTSEPQLRSVGHELIDLAKEMGFKVFGRAGLQRGRWVVLDFVDVVVHLFDEEFRRFYDLEMLWGDAPKLRWRQRTRRKTPHAQFEDKI
ncbi:MAG: ribosome silencing factor [Sedimentisphaerales bacterium]|nr:ribosome silencing factor [Sedimentisphaerales bacterium]